MFHKLKNLLLKFSSKKEKDDKFKEGELIGFRDANGQQFYLERDNFAKEILPYNIQQNWDNPQGLYEVILGFLDFPLELEIAARRLLEIDEIPERSCAIASIVFIKNNKIIEAREIVEKYLSKYSPTAAILTNLAKTYEGKNDVEEILLKAVQLDPNFKNSLEYWLAIREERIGEESYRKDLLDLCKIPNSWRPQLYLSGILLNEKNFEGSLPLFKHVLDTAPLDSDALAVLSGYFGINAYREEIISYVLPFYTYKCQESLGLLQNILQAFYELKRIDEGLSFIQNLELTLSSEKESFKFDLLGFTKVLDHYKKMLQENLNEKIIGA